MHTPTELRTVMAGAWNVYGTCNGHVYRQAHVRVHAIYVSIRACTFSAVPAGNKFDMLPWGIIPKILSVIFLPWLWRGSQVVVKPEDRDTPGLFIESKQVCPCMYLYALCMYISCIIYMHYICAHVCIYMHYLCIYHVLSICIIYVYIMYYMYVYIM